MRRLLRPQCVEQTFLLARAPRGLRRITTSPALPVQVQHIPIPKIILPQNTCLDHSCMQTFLSYVERAKISKESSWYAGTHYEYTALTSLIRLGFSLHRTGKTADGGIDLMGYWVLPQFLKPMPVIIQCKFRRSFDDTCRPEHVRQLIGAFENCPPNWRNKNVLGLLISSSRGTSGVLNAMAASSSPLGFINMSQTGVLEQFVWNRAASECGLEGVGVTVRHTPSSPVAPARPLRPVVCREREQGSEGEGWKVQLNKRGKLKRSLTTALKANGGITVRAPVRKDIQLTWLGEPIFPAPPFPADAAVELPAPHVATPCSGELPVTVKKRIGRPPGSRNLRTLIMEAAIARGAPPRPKRVSKTTKTARNALDDSI